jgi:hypothetical protein
MPADDLTISFSWGSVVYFVLSALKMLGIKGRWIIRFSNLILSCAGNLIAAHLQGKPLSVAMIMSIITSVLVADGASNIGTSKNQEK